MDQVDAVEAIGRPGAGDRHRVVFSYTIEGDIRFISHHDTMRMFRRALTRAGLPLRYTEGFNPHPRMMFPLPRPVGVASRAEHLVVEFDHPVEPPAAAARLAGQLPQGIEITGARLLPAGEKLLPDAVRYQLELDSFDAAGYPAGVDRLLQSDVVEVERLDPSAATRRTVNIRPYLEDAAITPEGVSFWLRVTPGGTARPAEVLSALGLDADSMLHRIRRMEIRWTKIPIVAVP